MAMPPPADTSEEVPKEDGSEVDPDADEEEAPEIEQEEDNNVPQVETVPEPAFNNASPTKVSRSLARSVIDLTSAANDE